jgi:hypothetical protein
MLTLRTSVCTGAAALLAAAAVTVGCTVTPRTPTPSPAPAGSAKDIDPCQSGQLDNCFRRDQMAEFVEIGKQLIVSYLTQHGVPEKSLPTLTYIPSATTASSRCVDPAGDPVQHDRSYDFCPADNTVYTGQNILWEAYQRYGAAGPISGLAHEYGHFLQSIAGVPDPTNPTETIQHEDQADCVSGAFIGYLTGRGVIEDPKDLDNVGQYLAATASAEGPGRDHGTAAERAQSFELGYTGALPACNRFYPATPLTV